MTVRNTHFLNINAGVPYPVDERATQIDHNGERLPTDLLVDCSLRWPESLGEVAFISAVAALPGLLTILFQSASSAIAIEGFKPLAVLTLPRSLVQVGRVYRVEAQTAGVDGWLVFGARALDTPYEGRFFLPAQSFLAPRAARPYPADALTGFGTLDAAQPLRGVVRLRAQEPLLLAKEQRVIGGQPRTCLVLRLTDAETADGFSPPVALQRAAGNASASNFLLFAGPCGGRPESGSCGDFPPIEFVNEVPPDCDGKLTLEFRGCAEIAALQGSCGASVSCGAGLTDICLPARLPDESGSLPSELSSLPPLSPPPQEPPEPPGPRPPESASLVLGTLPYLDCFGGGQFANFVTREGSWEGMRIPSHSPLCPAEPPESASLSSEPLDPYWALTSTTAALPAVTTWNGFDPTTLSRRVTTEVEILVGPNGAQHNGGLVVHYRLLPASGVYAYYLVDIDYENQQFAVRRYAGRSFGVVAAASVPGILLDRWYRITVEIRPGTRIDQAIVQARLQGIDLTAVDATLGPLTISDYGIGMGGKFGFGTRRSTAGFRMFMDESLE